MSTIVYLKKSTKPDKKFMVLVDGKTVHFGAKGMSDYTIHKDKERMRRYENRHKNREVWGKSGIKTAGFWSKWILWNKPGFDASKRDTARRFGINIRSGWPRSSHKPARKSSRKGALSSRKVRSRKVRSRKVRSRKVRSRKGSRRFGLTKIDYEAIKEKPRTTSLLIKKLTDELEDFKQKITDNIGDVEMMIAYLITKEDPSTRDELDKKLISQYLGNIKQMVAENSVYNAKIRNIELILNKLFN
jgi:hypothetical protein